MFARPFACILPVHWPAAQDQEFSVGFVNLYKDRQSIMFSRCLTYDCECLVKNAAFEISATERNKSRGYVATRMLLKLHLDINYSLTDYYYSFFL